MKEKNINQKLENKVKKIHNLFSKRSYQDSFIHIEELFKKSLKHKKDKYIAISNTLFGYYYFNLNNIDKSKEYYTKAINIYSKNEEKYILDLKAALNSLAVLFKHKADYKNALKSLYKSVYLSKKYNIENSIAYNNLASFYSNQKDYEKALFYYKKALESENLGKKPNNEVIIKYLINLANLYILINELDRAIDIYEKAISYSKKENNKLTLILTLKGYSKLLIKKGLIKKAKNYINEAIDLSKKLNYELHLVDLLLLKSEINQGNFKERLILSALNQAKKNNQNKLYNVYEKLLEYYEESEQYEKCFKINKEFLIYKNQKYQREKEQRLLELQEKYESEQKDRLLQQEKKFNEQLREKNKALESALQQQKIIELQMKSLQLQLSPHFIFNTLQSIQSFIFDSDPILANDYIAEFAGLMRAILEASRQDYISVETEMQILQSYLSLEQKRFHHRFQFQLIADNVDAPNTLIPSMLLQPFVENAIVHGVSSLENGQINILFRQKNETLFVHIIDNGVGWQKQSKKSGHQSMALQILKERCKESQNSEQFQYQFKKVATKQGTHIVVGIWTYKVPVLSELETIVQDLT